MPLVVLFAGLFLASFARAEDDRQIVVVAFGDSLSNNYRLPAAAGFAPQLQKQLLSIGLNATVIKAANDGDTSANGLARTDWMLEDKPDIVVVEFGANDMLNGSSVPLLHEFLDEIVDKIKQSGAKVLIAGMYSIANNGPKYQEEFRNAYIEVSKKHDVLLYPFFLQDVYGDPELMQLDGKHPRAKGVRIIATNIAPCVIQALNKEPSPEETSPAPNLLCGVGE